jgi:hypothetical protein
VAHLDELYRPGWKASDQASFRVRVADAVAGEGWVVDGSFSGLAFDLTLARADTLIVIERPRWLCLWRPAFRVRSRRDAARFTRGMPGAIRLEFDAGRLALQRRPPTTFRTPEVRRADHAEQRTIADRSCA